MPKAMRSFHHIQVDGESLGTKSMPTGICPGHKCELNLSHTESEHWMYSVQDDLLLLVHLVGQRSLLINAALVDQKSYTDSSLLENPHCDKNALTGLDPGQPLIPHPLLRW